MSTETEHKKVPSLIWMKLTIVLCKMS